MKALACKTRRQRSDSGIVSGVCALSGSQQPGFGLWSRQREHTWIGKHHVCSSKQTGLCADSAPSASQKTQMDIYFQKDPITSIMTRSKRHVQINATGACNSTELL
eukprot:3866242-Amphidinium_carterae.1